MKKLLLLAAFLFALPAYGQTGARYDGVVIDQTGKPVVGINVRVCNSPAAGQPCTPLANIFSDVNLTFPQANPTTTDFLGNFYFYVASGTYELEFSGAGLTTKQVPDVTITIPGGGGGGGGVSSVTGTANQVTVVNSTSTPVVSLPSPLVLPGALTAPSAVTFSGMSHGGPICSTFGTGVLFNSSLGSACTDIYCAQLKGDGVTDDTAAMQACANAVPTSGGTIIIPAGLNVLITKAGGGPITFPNPTTVHCDGSDSWGAVEASESVHFQTADPIVIFQAGTIGGTIKHYGLQLEYCAFRDVSPGNNTALGGVLFANINRNRMLRTSFEDFFRPPIAPPPLPAITGGGSGGTGFFVKLTCVTDATGETMPSAEAALASNSNPLTITAPGTAGCAAPSTGYRIWATSTTTGKETLQPATGNCTLNTSGTGCALTSNWVGTVSGMAATTNQPNNYPIHDSSAGFGWMTNSQAGANNTQTDASYDLWQQIFVRNTQECAIMNGGTQTLQGQGELACNLYDVYLFGGTGILQLKDMSMENISTAPAGFRHLILSGSSPSSIMGNKFEGNVAVPNTVTCIEVNSSRNTIIGNTFTKCNQIGIEVNLSPGGGLLNSNTIDITSQASNNTPLLSGFAGNPLDIVWGNNANGGVGAQVPMLALDSFTVATLPTPSSVITGTLVEVTDSLSVGNCTTGSGTFLSLCRSNGSAWVGIGDGAGSTSQTRRTCAIIIGADNATVALANSDLGPQGRLCFVPAAATVVEVEVAANIGTPNVIPGRNHAGTAANLVSSALATAAAGGIACSNTGGTVGLDGVTTCSATLINTSLSAGDYFELTSGTAGGSASRMSIFITYTIN